MGCCGRGCQAVCKPHIVPARDRVCWCAGMPAAHAALVGCILTVRCMQRCQGELQCSVRGIACNAAGPDLFWTAVDRSAYEKQVPPVVAAEVVLPLLQDQRMPSAKGQGHSVPLAFKGPSVGGPTSDARWLIQSD